MDRVLGESGVRADHRSGRRRLKAQLEQRRELEQAREHGDWKRLRRGWCWGLEAFREEMLERIGEQRSGQHHGEELHESDEQKAERLVTEELRRVGGLGSDLKQRLKTDPVKCRIAARLRAETPITWNWIAERLAMGHWRTAANAVRNLRKQTK